jgi:predicted secreted protein
MVKKLGRETLVKKNSVVIAGVRVKNIAFDFTPADISDDDSVGFQTLLEDSTSQVCSFDLEGVYTSPVLRDIAIDPAVSKLVTDLTFTFASGTASKTVISGDFFMTNYKEGHDYKEAGTFSASFTSSGAWALA